jgi:exopolysaccharide biosynthesis WecB/TagA/CpsF family protein
MECIGLKCACLITKGWIPPDKNGTDLFPALLAQLRGKACRLFFLGGGPKVGALVKRKIEEDWPHVEIVGWCDGFFSKEELPAIRNQVSNARPTMLLIGMGSPRQEALAFDFLQIPDLQLVWAVGGLRSIVRANIAGARLDANATT